MSTSRLRILTVTGTVFVLVATGCQVLDFSPRYAEGEIDIFDNLFSVAVPDEDHAVAVGYLGTAYWTEDGGETWHKGRTDTLESLYSVSMATARHGWAVGQHGTILNTDDGGKTWTAQPNLKKDEGAHLFGVHAIDSKRAWAVGEWGTRIFTEDGGRTWQDHSLTITLGHPQYVWLSAVDQDKVRDGEKVYEDVGLNNVFCRPQPSQQCWLVGEFGYIFYSDDLGQTWTRAEIVGDIRVDPIVFGYNQIEIPEENVAQMEEFAAQIEDATHLNVLIEPYVSDREIADFGSPEDPFQLFDILSARIGEARAILEDAGVLSDRFRMPNKPPWDFEDFLADDPTFLQRYIEGRRADQPKLQVGVIQNPYLYTVRFEDAENGLIAGLGGVILRSTDGGRTWRYRILDRKQAVFSIVNTDERAIAVGEKGLIRFSQDDGNTWNPPEEGMFPSVFTFMRDLAFEREKRIGFIVGQEGMVMRSRDGGNTWAQVLPPESRRRRSTI